MTIRLIMMASALGTLAACQLALPESGAGAQLDAPLTVQSKSLPSSNQQNQEIQAVTSESAPVAATVLSRRILLLTILWRRWAPVVHLLPLNPGDSW